MKTTVLLILVLLNLAAGAGCRLFQPMEDPIRYYTLATPSAPSASGEQQAGAPMVGVAPIVIPGYLMRDAVVVRRGPQEIRYRDYDRWAERLDRSMQRAVMADLGGRLGPGSVRLNGWRREEVRCELYASVTRFEFDESGRVVLEVNWRLTEPGAGREIVARTSRIEKAGPAPDQDMPGAVGVLGEALVDWNSEIAAAIRGLGS